MQEIKPYTYLIGWSKLNVWYYGCQYSNKCFPENLWKTYFTSSKYVKQMREYCGEPDIVQIRRVFNSKEVCINWESKVLCRLKVIYKDNWLNRTDSKAIIDEFGSIRMSNRNIGIEARIISRNNMLKNNPMKNRDVVKKSMETRKKNGIINKYFFKCGENHIFKINPQSLEKRKLWLKGRKWYNNGIIQKQLLECPLGWNKGRLIKLEKKNEDITFDNFRINDFSLHSYNTSITDGSIDPSRAIDATPSSITPTDALTAINDNNKACLVNTEQLKDLQDWIKETNESVKASNRGSN